MFVLSTGRCICSHHRTDRPEFGSNSETRTRFYMCSKRREGDTSSLRCFSLVFLKKANNSLSSFVASQAEVALCLNSFFNRVLYGQNPILLRNALNVFFIFTICFGTDLIWSHLKSSVGTNCRASSLPLAGRTAAVILAFCFAKAKTTGGAVR